MEVEMSNPELDRRAMLGAGALAAAALTAAPANAQPSTAAAFQPKPLPFNPAAVPGLSEKLLRSHFDNNYTGAVRRLGQIEAQLSGLTPASTPGFQLNGLKREELIAWNSMILHEVYFASLGQPAGPSGALATALERDFGSHDRWAAEFASTGKALGGGSGWVLLTWSPRDRRLVNTWASDHTQTLAGGAPLLALDMYEHAYHMDFGAAAGAYVDAFMKALNWRSASEAYARLAA
ncbi:superoxide dismutase [Phenylobacterium sp.]|uniref:superoxide dismutase n=1 Tax=Phenylobacterium sp. TaxID=1871053 RepID=UPI0025E7972B|nr:Fe-Mn family superoxide dismutase [Phenylobacterium sp.]